MKITPRKIKNRIILFYKSKLKPFPHIIPNYAGNESASRYKLMHVSAFSYANAGDILLPIVLRNLFEMQIGKILWKSNRVHKIVDKKNVSEINKKDGLVIGGGGLFLKDTNANEISGWQWPCSIDLLNKINVPIIMFAVGYNRFRGQDDFEPYFKENLNSFVAKAKFIGIRNYGSINMLKTYLNDDELRNKLVFQPCMTTVISKIYPNFVNYNKKEDFIAVNCAFDRQKLRSVDESILQSIANVILSLSKEIKIKYYSHMGSDNEILHYFDEVGVKYELNNLNRADQIIKEYSKPKLVIGMRGHSQMIPFGCKTPILSIISHNKMQWFLNDIQHPDWGVDVLEDDFENKLLKKSINIYNNYTDIINEINIQQANLWNITVENMNNIKNILENETT